MCERKEHRALAEDDFPVAIEGAEFIWFEEGSWL